MIYISGKTDEAFEDFARSLKIKPDFAKGKVFDFNFHGGS
jgi:hypothetical protein